MRRPHGGVAGSAPAWHPFPGRESLPADDKGAVMEFTDFFQFDKFLAPILIKIVYWVGLFVILLVFLGSVLGMNLAYYGERPGIGTILFTFVLCAAWALVWRILCEIWIVVFSINDRLGAIAQQSKS